MPKLTELVAVGSLANDDILVVSTNTAGAANTNKITAQNVRSYTDFFQLPGDANAVSRTFTDKARERVSVLDFGADKTGANDSTAAFLAAVAYGVNNGGVVCEVPAGKYITSNTIDVTANNIEFVGQGGLTSQSIIEGQHISGAVFDFSAQRGGLRGIRVSANNARQAAAGGTEKYGVLIEGPDVASGAVHNNMIFEDVMVDKQNEDGFHVVGDIRGSVFREVVCADNGQHGFVFGDGTRKGRTNLDLAPFQWAMYDCTALENGGNGLLIGALTQTTPCDNVYMINFNSISNAWDTGVRENTYQVWARCSQMTIVGGDVADPYYASGTTITTGGARSGNPTPSDGWFCRGNGIVFTNPHFASLLSSIDFDTTCAEVEVYGLHVEIGAYGIAQAVAVSNGPSIQGFTFRGVSQPGATTLLENQVANANIRIDGITYRGDAATAFDIKQDGTPTTVAIATGVLETTDRVTQLQGEGDVADAIDTIQYASGASGRLGHEITLLRPAYDITLNNATGNIITGTGGNLVMDATRPVIKLIYDGANWAVI